MEHPAYSPIARFSPASIPVDVFADVFADAPGRPPIRADGQDPGSAPGGGTPVFDALAAIVRSIVDHIQYGAMVVDAAGLVSFANRAAVHECRRQSSMLRIDNGRLVAPQGSDGRRIAAALDGARAGRWSMLRLGADPAPLMVAVLPLSASACQAEPLVLLMFGLRQCAESVALLLYARACRLTPAETRVLRGLAEGLAPQQIASRDRVLLSTVRTHVRNIREKTGTRSITELTHALIGLPGIMPAVVG